MLLSLTTRRYHTLDETGGMLWQGIAMGATVGETVVRMAEVWDASDTQIAADALELIDDLRDRRLIVPAGAAGAANAPRPRPRRSVAQTIRDRPPSVAACLWRLGIVHLLLRTIGLRRLLRRIGAPPAARRQSISPELRQLLARRVAHAVAWYPFGAACLEHSVCLLWLIRKAGSDAVLRIGIRPFPLLAHAWLEHAGSPVNDSPEHIALFQPFPTTDLESP